MTAASVKDVAALAGVSVGTVSNVLNRPGKVSASTIDRVHDAIDRLGFVRNDAARQLRAGHSRSIGLIVLDVGNPFFTDVARGAEQAADAADSAILLGSSEQRAERESRYLELFEEQRLRGVLISPVGDVTGRLAQLRARGIPSVLVDREADPEEWCSVSVDDVAGGRIAAQHLIEQGYRRIAFVGGPLSIRQIADRLEGARAAVEENGECELEVVELPAPTILSGRAAGAQLAERAADARPDAVFAANDLIATGVLQALVLGNSIRVPEEMGLIGYDDIDFAPAAVVPISSVRQPSELIGRTAVELVLEEADAPDGHEHRRVTFQPELVVRESSLRLG